MQEEGLLFSTFDNVPFCMDFLLYAVRPDNQYRLMWDFFILILVIYSSVTGPYGSAFAGDQTMTWFSVFVDLCFWADMALSFWTGFDKGFEVVMEKAPIVKNYLTSWFFIDLIATVDWGLLIATSGFESDSPLVRLLRLLKVLRLARASRLINRLTATWTLHTAYIEALKFFFYVFMVGHLLASFFYMWPTLMTCPRDGIAVAVEMPGFSVDGVDKLDTFDADVDAVKGFIDSADIADGTGWYYADTCMTGSWRQGYGLETICELLEPNADGVVHTKGDDGVWTGNYRSLPFETAEDFAILEECYVAAARDNTHSVIRDSAHIPVSAVCKRCMNPMRSYIDAYYWSLTTMTTIGYGDRGPGTENEILFVLFSEVFGLCVFALLLMQINTLGEVVGAAEQKKNDEKNGVIGFLRTQTQASDDLVMEVVRYLNFRNASLSGHAFDKEDEDFRMLSPGIIEQIEIAVYRPTLERVRFFGWNKEDELELMQVRKMFDDIDTDNGGTLDGNETKALFTKLNVPLDDAQYKHVMSELDPEGDGEVDFEEFQHWWFLKKNGRPRMQKCPSLFLDALCRKLQTAPFAIGEKVVREGDYGKSLLIVLSGSLIVYRDTSHFPYEEVEGDKEFEQTQVQPRPAHLSETVAAEDREPIVGFASCLGTKQWKTVGNRTSDWVVVAQSYVDTAYVIREDIVECFETEWDGGQEQMVEVAKHHYEVDTSGGSKDAQQEEDSELSPEDEEMSARIDALNEKMCARLASVEKAMDDKLNNILELMRDQQGKGDMMNSTSAT